MSATIRRSRDTLSTHPRLWVTSSSGWGSVVRRVKSVGAGVTSGVRLPTLDALASGLRYRVVALGSGGERWSGPADCMSPLIQSDLRPMLEEARAGAGFLTTPTVWERHYADTLRDPVRFKQAYDEFVTHPALWRQERLQQWWESTSESQRLEWLMSWPLLMEDAQRAQWLNTWNGELND
ncbi:MAG: hypothetical protein R3C68_05330 [Myxococcota bacterium]